MAIAGSLIKGATKVVGKAINVAKKKKKDLDTKGRRVKKKLVNKELDKAEVSSNPIEAGDKANKSIKRIINTSEKYETFQKDVASWDKYGSEDYATDFSEEN